MCVKFKLPSTRQFILWATVYENVFPFHILTTSGFMNLIWKILLICFPLIVGEIEQLFIYILTVCISFNFFLVSLYVFLYIIHINSVTYMANFFSSLLFIFYLFYGVFFVLFLLDTGFKFSCSEVCYSFMASIFCDMLILPTVRSPK